MELKSAPATPAYIPDRDLGELFIAVQTARVLKDSKTFVDCIPKEDPATILAAYKNEKDTGGFSLEDFVQAHFLPPPPPVTDTIEGNKDMIRHVQSHWSYLTRESRTTEKYTTLIPLPYPYIVPGGRFRELFYWDSYFTLIGLLESGEDALALGMLRNFAFLVHRFGHIPNGNRTYFLSRSQPPFFAEMIQAYAQKHGLNAVMEFLPALETEYIYWTADANKVHAGNPVSGKCVWLNGIVLNRYTGNGEVPRAEAYDKELGWAQALNEEQRPAFYRNLRAACESGWDFSSRWFADGKNKATLRCENLIPVCLNSLLYACEMQLAQMYGSKAEGTLAKKYASRAAVRKAGVLEYCWCAEQGWFTDYDFVARSFNAVNSLATVYPLFFGLATQQQADSVARLLEEKFLCPGGVVTTLVASGEQWDYPNGWAPLHWLTVIGLWNYGYNELAKTIAFRWLKTNEDVFVKERKMMEKYNVINPALAGGGGNYENQDGFGWTNGVAIALHGWLSGMDK